jgi:hypothetical protein
MPQINILILNQFEAEAQCACPTPCVEHLGLPNTYLPLGYQSRRAADHVVERMGGDATGFSGFAKLLDHLCLKAERVVAPSSHCGLFWSL